MRTHDKTPAAPNKVQARILSLLADLPPEGQVLVEQFARFVHEQAQRGQSVATAPMPGKQVPYMYPTVPVPHSVINGLIGLWPPVGGDALEDSEALYDEV